MTHMAERNAWPPQMGPPRRIRPVIRVAVSNRQHTLKLDVPRLKRRARRVLRDMGLTDTELSVVFVDDGEMQRLNSAYRSIDRPTDVDRKSTRLNSSHIQKSRMPSSA